MTEFKTRLEKVRLKNLKVVHKRNHSWPIEKKVEVVSQYLVLGNAKLVSAITGVGHDLIRAWKTQPWWSDLEKEIRATQSIEVDSKLSKIIDKSLEAVMDRLENGEVYYDFKTGEVKRKPVSMKDAAKVSYDMLTKRDLIRKGDGPDQHAVQSSVAEQLSLLAKEFSKWTGKPLPNGEIIDVVAKEQNAIHEEREEGLQEGSSFVHEQAFGREEEGRTEPGSSPDGEGRESS